MLEVGVVVCREAQVRAVRSRGRQLRRQQDTAAGDDSKARQGKVKAMADVACRAARPEVQDAQFGR